MNLFVLAGTFLTIFGLGLIIMIVMMSLKPYRGNCIKLYGRISDYTEIKEGVFSPVVKVYCSLIEYTFVDKQRVKSYSRRTGKQVKVMFNRESPERSEIRMSVFSADMLAALFVFILGLTALAGGSEIIRLKLIELFLQMKGSYFPHSDLNGESVFGILFLIFFMIDGWLVLQIMIPRKGYKKAEGVVTDNIDAGFEHKGGFRYKRKYTYRAVFSYEGKEYEFTDEAITHIRKAPVGKAVNIAFNPHNPNEAMILNPERDCQEDCVKLPFSIVNFYQK